MSSDWKSDETVVIQGVDAVVREVQGGGVEWQVSWNSRQVQTRAIDQETATLWPGATAAISTADGTFHQRKKMTEQ